MTKKKFFAFLTALSCVMCTLPLSVSAEVESVNELIFTEDGNIVKIQDRGTYGLLVDTGEHEITEETLTAFGYDERFALYELDEFNERGMLLGNTLTGGEKNNYVIEGRYVPNEDLNLLARKLILESDSVENVQLIHFERRGMYPDIQLVYRVELVTPDPESKTFDTSAIPELVDFKYEVRIDDGVFWLRSNYNRDGEFYKNYLEANSGATKAEKYEYLLAYGNAVQEKYSDIFVSIKPVVMFMGVASPEIITFSAWDNAGDSNTDGAVDASDAADVLTIAAQNGTGAGIKATSANDVNADGNVDASDAAAVLCYAAAQGTGAEVSWVDILRK